MKYCQGWVPNIQACRLQLQYEIVKGVDDSSSARPSRCPCKSCWDYGQGHGGRDTQDRWNKFEPNNGEMEVSTRLHH
jgi:hypothetical protein